MAAGRGDGPGRHRRGVPVVRDERLPQLHLGHLPLTGSTPAGGQLALLAGAAAEGRGKPMKRLSRWCWLWSAILLVPSAAPADEPVLDLTAAVVVAPAGLSGPENKAVAMFAEEVQKQIGRASCRERVWT